MVFVVVAFVFSFFRCFSCFHLSFVFFFFFFFFFLLFFLFFSFCLCFFLAQRCGGHKRHTLEGGLRSPFWHSVMRTKGRFLFSIFHFLCTLAMASIDPTPEEMQQWTNLSSVLAWAGLAGDPAETTSPVGSFLHHLGFLSTAPVRMLGMIPANDLTEFLRE